jgi:hypothetical protein
MNVAHSIPDLTPTQLEYLEADLGGARGPEVQANAEAWAIANGFQLEDVEQEDPLGNWDDELEDEDLATLMREEDTTAFRAELEKCEQLKGRPLTSAEQDWLLDQIPEQGNMPNLASLYGERIKDRPTTPEGRRAAMAEAAADARARVEEANPEDEPPLPKRAKEVDLATETKEERVARMAGAAADVEQRPPAVSVPAGLESE